MDTQTQTGTHTHPTSLLFDVHFQGNLNLLITNSTAIENWGMGSDDNLSYCHTYIQFE